MKVFTFTEARQNLASVLDFAQKEGGVSVTRPDGRTFIIQPMETPLSPLAIEGVDLKVSKDEILDFVHQGRRV